MTTVRNCRHGCADCVRPERVVRITIRFAVGTASRMNSEQAGRTRRSRRLNVPDQHNTSGQGCLDSCWRGGRTYQDQCRPGRHHRGGRRSRSRTTALVATRDRVRRARFAARRLSSSPASGLSSLVSRYSFTNIGCMMPSSQRREPPGASGRSRGSLTESRALPESRLCTGPHARLWVCRTPRSS